MFQSYALSRSNIDDTAVWRSITNGAGAVGGTSIFDTTLITAPDFLTGKSILLRSGPAKGEMRPVTVFNNATGEITVSPAFVDNTGAPVQIPAQVMFSVVNFSNGYFHQVNQPLVIDVWSTYQNQISVTNGAADKALPDLTVAGIPAGATVLRVVALCKFRTIENTNAAVNNLAGAQSIQCQKAVAGAYINAISFGGGDFSVPATTVQGGDIAIGNIDIKAQVPANGAVMNWKLTNGVAAQNQLNFNDIQTGIRIYVSV